jgi:glycosyltransferase involved in cell wall biosynthesis
MAGTRRVKSTHHHGSHLDLLDEPSGGMPKDVDAVVVPTARNVATLKEAARVANKLDATLVVLSSKYSSSREVAETVKRVKLIAVDTDAISTDVVPSFETCRLLEQTRFERRTDTSRKRNFGLLLARLIGWQRILFLDDDIEIPKPLDLREAAGLTDRYAGVGLENKGMHDNSVVCHAYREAGGLQKVFIGGGALVVGEKSMTSFFPNIYNEDWFFLLDDDGLRPTTVTGTAIQKPYDPYREERAKKEELGDSLAEGLFWLLDNGRTLHDATVEHWRDFLHNRAEFITEVIGMVKHMDGDAMQRSQMLLALKAARGRCQYIDPDMCVKYVDAWRSDRLRWRLHVEAMRHKHWTGRLTTPAGVDRLFRALGVPNRAVHLRLPR